MTELSAPSAATTARPRQTADVAWYHGAVAGVLAAGAALVTSELLSGISASLPSLVVEVGDAVIDRAPEAMVDLGKSLFGTGDKQALVVGTTILALLFGGGLGIVSRTRRTPLVVGFAAFGALGTWAALRDDRYGVLATLFVAVTSVVVGVAVFGLLVGARARQAVPAASAQAGSLVRAPVGTDGGTDGLPRRSFLAAAVATGAVVAAGGLLGPALRRRHNVEAARDAVADQLVAQGPPPAASVPTGVLDTEVPGISRFLTPNDDFYRIDTALVAPQVDPDDWSLEVTGMVDRPLDLSFDDLLAMDQVEEVVTIACVSNEVGGDLIGNARWGGVLLADLLTMAGVQEGATQVVGRSVDDWTAGFPTELALDGRPALVAITMNGEPLPVEHGFPARLIVPGLYGYVSATKWLRSIELRTWEDFDGYWIPRGWSKEGPIKTQSRIDVPGDGSKLPAGPTAIAGVAWAPGRGIARVEVQVDDAEWVAATLAPVATDLTWVQWVHRWDATEGGHVVRVRATDSDGATQTDERRPPAPDGATGYHTIEVSVS
jgi:DMSO/TMAO reductase YedYZ molybdopterin-dependent catalytic subunit